MQTQASQTNGGATAATTQLDPGLVEVLEAELVAAQIEPSIDRPAGPAAAVLLATGVSCLTLGVLTGLVAAFAGVEESLTWSRRVGDLSGVSLITIAVFFATWGVFAVLWRRSSPSLRRTGIATAVLFGLCVVATFAPVIHLIESTR